MKEKGIINLSVNNLVEARTFLHRMKVDELIRSAIIHIPGCYDPDSKMPLVLALHGSGDSARGMMMDTGWIPKAEESGFIAVFPQGEPPNTDRRVGFFTNPRLWNDGSGRFKIERDDVRFIRQLLDFIIGNYAVDQGRVFVTGFSNGASMVFRLGVELNNIFAAIAPVAGALWQKDFYLDNPVSLMYITGTVDPLNPINGGRFWPTFGDRLGGRGIGKPPVEEHITTWVDALGCSEGTTRIFQERGVGVKIFRNCRGESEVVYYEIQGLGHQWPGGQRIFPRLLSLRRKNAIDATSLIWSFFNGHGRERERQEAMRVSKG